MTKTDVKIKEIITIEEKAIMTEYLVNAHFTEDEYGTVRYTPYMFDPALTTTFFLYCVEGLEFEKENNTDDASNIDDDADKIEVITENVYESVIADEELMELYSSILAVKVTDNEHPNIQMVRMLHAIMNDVADMVEFRKQQLIHNYPVIINKLTEILDIQKQVDDVRLEIAMNENTVLQQQIKENTYGEEVMEHMTPEEMASLNKKILDGDMDYSKMANLVVQKYLDGKNSNEGKVVDIKATKAKSSTQRKKSSSTAVNVKSDK